VIAESPALSDMSLCNRWIEMRVRLLNRAEISIMSPGFLSDKRAVVSVVIGLISS